MLLFKKNLPKPLVLLLACIIVYCAVFSIFVVWKYNNFYYDCMDLAIFNQVFFNTLHGLPFASTIQFPTYLGDHFSPFILLLVPFYALHPGPITLLIMQTIVIGLTALPIYFIAQEMLGPRKTWLAFGVAILWLVNPIVHNMNFFEFEMTPFALLGIFWMLYCYRKKYLKGFIITLFLTLLVREDAALIVAMFSVLALLEKRSRFWKIFPFLAALIYSGISFSIISHFAQSGSYKFVVFYDWLGGTSFGNILWNYLTHPLQVISHIFTLNNLLFIITLGFPFLYLAYLPSPFLVLLAPSIAQILLTKTSGTPSELMTHHGGYLLIGLFMVTLDNLRRITANRLPHWLPEVFKNTRMLYGLILLTSTIATILYGSIAPIAFAWKVNNQASNKKAMASLIPANAATATTYDFLAPLSTRQHIYALSYAFSGKSQFAQSDYALPGDTEYLLIDWQDILNMKMIMKPEISDTLAANMNTILSQFELISADGPLTLWKKRAIHSQKISTFHADFSDRTDTKKNDPHIENILPNDDRLTVSLLLPQDISIQQNFYVEVLTPKRNFILPSDYAFSTLEEWPVNNSIKMDIFIPNQEQVGAQIKLFTWTKGRAIFSTLKSIGRISDARLIESYPAVTSK